MCNWESKYSDHIVDFKKIHVDESWNILFDKLMNDDEMKKLEKSLSKIIEKILELKNEKINIYPCPDDIFNAFNLTNYNNVKVCILGQDPYIGHENNIPQAMGLSFSVPDGFKLPSSLINIYKNMMKYNVINEMPKKGNLSKWAQQGCLMLNSSLTVQQGISNSHAKYWKWFTDYIIEYISDNMENIIFVLWGKNAIDKLSLINKNNNHKFIISSHPSGLSCNKNVGAYPAFNDMDHFNTINAYLCENKKNIIDWNP